MLTIKFVPPGNRLLEIGFGGGELLLKLKNQYKELYGIEVSKKNVISFKKKLKEKKIENIFVRVEDANKKLNFRNYFFDTILLVDVFEHLIDPYFVIDECHRLLKKRGNLIIHVPNVAFLLNRIRLLFGKLPITSYDVGWDGGHLHYFTTSSLKKLFKEKGFEITDIAHGGLFYKFRSWWGSLLCGGIMIKGIKK